MLRFNTLKIFSLVGNGLVAFPWSSLIPSLASKGGISFVCQSGLQTAPGGHRLPLLRFRRLAVAEISGLQHGFVPVHAKSLMLSLCI